jgi:cyclopropane-fatty-acyl-phospholipid synthase
MELDNLEDIGTHYVKALRLWREKFVANWPYIKSSYIKQHSQRTEAEMEAFRRRWIVCIPFQTVFGLV